MRRIGVWPAFLVFAGAGCASDPPIRAPATTTAVPAPPDAPPDATPPPASKPAAYRPGVRIHWAAREVEVDAEVVLREGTLELLACSPETKEHESILRVNARPLHIYEALGLIGVTPGRPAAWDRKNDRTIPASGDAMTLRIRYRQEGRERIEPAHEWLRDAESGRPAQPIPWVFAGSMRLDDGTFYADVDGTVVTVVDFSSALIGVAGNHSADNAELWLTPNLERIPPLHTKCELLIRTAAKN